VRKAKPKLHDMWSRDLQEKNMWHRNFALLSKSFVKNMDFHVS